MLTVKNKSRQMFVLNLPTGIDYDGHPAGEPTTGEYTLSAATADGEVGMTQVTKLLPGSLTWLAGEVKGKLPVGLALIPEFKAACDAGTLVVQS